MNDWYYFFNCVDDNLATSAYRIFEEQSKAEILQWFSREDVGKDQKEDFIQALVEFKDDCGDFYHYRAYLLAAEALNYFKDCSRGDAIALQLLKWSYAYFRQDKQDWQIVPQPLVEAARLTVETTDRQRVISAFVHIVHTTQSQHILHIAAEKLGKLDLENKSAIAALVLLLQFTQNESTVWDVTCSLMQIDPDNPAVIPTLAKLVSANTDEWSDYDIRWHTIRYAIEALKEIATGNETAINALIELTPTISNIIANHCAIDNLEKIAIGNEAAINHMIDLMQTTVDKYICLNAVRNLEKIAPGSQPAIAALTEFIQIAQGDRLWFSAAKALWQIDKGNANAIATLVQIIANTADSFDLKQAANYLWEIDPENVDAVSALTERMKTADESVCCAAASLVKFEPDNELAISTLLQIVQSNDYLNYRLQAVDGLLNIDPNNQIAIKSLFELVQYLGQSPFAPNYLESISYSATLSLTKIDLSNQQAIAAMVNLLNNTENRFYLMIAVGSLERFTVGITVGNRDAIAALTKLIDSTEDNYLLLDVARSLGKIEPGNQKALSTLIEFIQTVDELDNTEIYDPEYEQSCRNNQQLDAADKLQEILPINQMPQVVVALKNYLSKSKQDSSYRYEACYRVIWHCAQNMTYPDFFEAWHKSL